MNAFRSFAGLVAVASLVIGCGATYSTPASPSPVGGPLAAALPGTWTLVSMQTPGQAEQATPIGAGYTLTLVDDRISVRADCNTCGGAYTLAGQSLTAGPALACTRAACPTMAFENAYTSVLSGESTVTLSDGQLLLASARGTLRFRR